MTIQQILAAGIAHICNPAPYTGYGWRVETDLAARDRAAQTLRTAEYGSPAWRDAQIALAGAEARLADLFGVTPQPRAFDLDDPYTQFFASVEQVEPVAPHAAGRDGCPQCNAPAVGDRIPTHTPRCPWNDPNF